MRKVSWFLSVCMALGVCASALRAQEPSAESELPYVYIKASNPGEDDHLGHGSPLRGLTLALSRDGNTMAVAAPAEDSAATGINGDQSDNSAYNAGAVYVFARTGGTWAQQAYVKASNTDGSDQFGFSLAISGDGNLLAVGANLEDSAATGINGDQSDNSAESAGAVYVFARTGGTWAQQAYVKASNTDPGDQFGFSIALSDDGNTMAVGAHVEASAATAINGDQSDNSAPSAGAVYVYTRSASTWNQQAYIKASNAEDGDRFGFCVALSADGNTLASCGYDEDGGSTGVNGDPSDNSVGGSGAAYVFTRRGATWTQEAYLKASNTRRGDAFGGSITISGDGLTLAVAAIDEDGMDPRIDGDQTGEQISEHSAGAVYIFGKFNGTWAQQAYVKPFNIREYDEFGARMQLSYDGNILAAASILQPGGGRGLNPDPRIFQAPESGAVYIFTRKPGQTAAPMPHAGPRNRFGWGQSVYIKAPNAEEYDEFGGSLGLSGDGRTLAVGARGEDGGSAGVGGDPEDNSVRDSGAAYVFTLPLL